MSDLPIELFKQMTGSNLANVQQTTGSSLVCVQQIPGYTADQVEVYTIAKVIYSKPQIPQELRDLGVTSLDQTELNLNYKGVSYIPHSIDMLTNLKKLDLRHNNLTYLPDSIGNLRNLEKLWLEANSLTSIPHSIGNLTNLKELDLRWNANLKGIPPSVVGLRNNGTKVDV